MAVKTESKLIFHQNHFFVSDLLFEASTSLGKLCMHHLCAFKIAHEVTSPCSRIRQVKNNKWNRHANLLRASLKETLLSETRMSILSRAKTPDVRTVDDVTSSSA